MQTVDGFIKENYELKYSEIAGSTMIIWNETTSTIYDFFVKFFGEIIEDGIIKGLSSADISKNMITESIKNNYGFTELILIQSDINLWS